MMDIECMTYAADYEKLGYTREEWYEMWYQGRLLEQLEKQPEDERYSTISEVG